MDRVDINRTMSITEEEVADIMDYHKWSDDQIKCGQGVREAIGKALKTIIELVPPCPDRTVAIRKLREARMDANSAITHNGRY